MREVIRMGAKDLKRIGARRNAIKNFNKLHAEGATIEIESILCWAARYGHVKVVKALLKEDIHIDIKRQALNDLFSFDKKGRMARILRRHLNRLEETSK